MNATTLEAGAEHAARNRLVINLLLVSSFVVILNETIMGVAVPRLMESSDATASAAQWVTTAFLLTMAVVIPMTGFLLQRLHTRAIFILAMSLFSLGTLAAALAPGLELLVVARVIQASGTAIMMPLLMTTVMTLVPPEDARQDDGQCHEGDLRRARDRSGAVGLDPQLFCTGAGCSCSCCRSRSPRCGSAGGASRTSRRRATAPLDIASVVLSVFAFGGSV